ncbi:glutathione S-transferase C-terminal domain-containing protein-like [Ptychodera flava]|uniref:glutathione S-transferase C-terminal domain-containing protein-like n=1 Tax=Ptychodera flava TaxID=63121 RepID=UPI00396A4475
MTSSASCEDTLYLSYYDNDSGTLSLESQITLFLHTFCQLTSSVCKVCLVRPLIKRKVFQLNTTFKIPESLQYNEILDEGSVPPYVRHCAPPVLLLRNEYASCCCCGLANILRNLVYKGDKEHPERNLTSYLGYNQTCLKACAESSQWTKLCEIEMPAAIEEFLRTGCHGDIPLAILKFENLLSQPVAMSNINKKRREVHKMMNPDNFVKSRGKCKHDGGVSESDEQGSQSETSRENVIVNTATRMQNMQVTGTETVEVTAPMKEIIDDGYIANDDENCHDNQDRTASGATRRKKKWRKPHSRRIIPTESLPTLPHLFAEGFEVSLADLVLFPSLYHYIAHTIKNDVSDIQEKIPQVFQWYKNMLTVPYVTEASEMCGLTPLITRDLQPVSQLDELSILQSEDSLKLQKLRSRKTIKTALKKEVPGLLDKLASNGIETAFKKHPCENIELEWNDFPEDVRPIQGDVTDERSLRKCHQVENIVSAVLTIAQPGDVIVDFCCGAGHVGITLAHLLPQCHVFLIENKIESLERAQSRVVDLKMKNVTLYHGNLEYFLGSFDIGVSLHACGVATDMVLAKCIACKAAFVSSPCCYGSVRNTHVITYPRSKTFKQVLSEEEYILIGHAADQTPWQFESDTAKQGKRCMGLIDGDRAERAREHGYLVTVCTMQPPSCTPKNNLLIGFPPSS